MPEENKKYEMLTLRLDKVGQDGNWSKTLTSPYMDTSIAEPNSETTTEPTSIPSPFARMELARTAFDIAASCKTWDDVPKRYQKIVSDCLDVAEIFFNYPLYSKYLKIIKWSKSNLNDVGFSNTEIGKTLKKFIDSDAKEYNFDQMSAIYLLNYTGENRPNKTGLNIIGATSPITMFFSIDNDLKYVGANIHFANNDKPFDGNFKSLEHRDIAFIQYLVDMKNKYSIENKKFAQYFQSLSDYIQIATDRLTSDKQLASDAQEYNRINIDENGNNYVEVLGYPLGCVQSKEVEKSDFEIASTILSSSVKPPLVLPIVAGNTYDKCAYINSSHLWGEESVAEQRPAEKSLSERILPGTNIQYPYLTISDFFEDTIIKMPYKLNYSAYFDGKIISGGDKLDCSYLLPLKSNIFEYFTTDELKEMIETSISGSVVKITLKIPIKNYSKKAKESFISYTKTYQQNEHIEQNKGGTIDARFGLGLFPLVKTTDVNVANYRIALLNKSSVDTLRFFNQTEEVKDVKVKERRKIGGPNECGIKTYVIEKQNFDRIDVCINDPRNRSKVHGCVIPNFEVESGNKTFRFAVDFGTTNTHIAYSIENAVQSSAFESVPQLIRLHANYGADWDIVAAFEDNYLPATSNMKFPIRSAFAEAHTINYNDETHVLSDANIPFRYESNGPNDYSDFRIGEDLKWSANRERIKHYIENIAFILHNKVLLEKGSLRNTQIRWFYPASMSTTIKRAMAYAWKEAYKKYFDFNFDFNFEGDSRVIYISESVAPYYHYNKKGGAMGVVATIDIGGGTTDVYINDGKKGDAGYLMSFRCASNAIFGDGYNNNITNNGFVNKYCENLEKNGKEENNDKGEDIGDIIEKIAQKGKSSELVSYFFSLASYNKPGLDFLNQLKNDKKLKYVFLIFYYAIIYHVAHAMKAKGIPMPQTVAFSGNGSKTLQVIAPYKETRVEFVKNIFEKVYVEKYPKDVSFILKFDSENPKEVTALGGLLDNAGDISPEILVLFGSDNKTFVNNQQSFNNITDEDKRKIVKNVEEFIDFIPTLNDKKALGDTYGLNVRIFEKVLEICKLDLSEYLNQGLEKINKIISEEESSTHEITESLFFYPIVGVLNNLAQKLYEMDINS
jgi:hypothetical protein